MTRQMRFLNVVIAGFGLLLFRSTGYGADKASELPVGVSPELIRLVTPKDNPSRPEKPHATTHPAIESRTLAERTRFWDDSGGA